MLNLFLDFVDEVDGAGAVDDTVIEGERKRSHLDGFVFLFPFEIISRRAVPTIRADRACCPHGRYDP